MKTMSPWIIWMLSPLLGLIAIIPYNQYLNVSAM